MATFNQIKSSIASSAPAIFIANRSKRIFLPGFRGIALFDVVKFFFGQVKKVGMTERASAIAFNFVMALPPAIIFFFTLIPHLPISKDFEKALYGIIRDVLPGQKNDSAIITFLHDFINKPRNELLSLGFILSLFFSSSAVMGIMRSFDKNYEGFKKRNTLSRRVVALRLTAILFIIVFASTLLLVMQTAVLKWLGVKSHLLRAIIHNGRWVVIVLLFFYSISVIYKLAPAVHKKWRLINPGSILATLLMLLFTLVFSWWVTHFSNYNQLYGSIGTILILMLLIYFNSLVLLIGFELNVSIVSLKKIADDRVNNPANGNQKSV